jgi:Acyl-CoA dehydrogenase, middle domain
VLCFRRHGSDGGTHDTAQRADDAGTVEAEQDGYRINGRKIWISGALDTRCAVAVFMGKSDPAAPPHAQQCMVLVPMATAGVRVVRPMTVFGQDDAPHGHAEMVFEDVRCAHKEGPPLCNATALQLGRSIGPCVHMICHLPRLPSSCRSDALVAANKIVVNRRLYMGR